MTRIEVLGLSLSELQREPCILCAKRFMLL